MMNNDIEKSLSLVYEIEGLLHVMSHRDIQRLPASVRHLLADKSRRLAEMLADTPDTTVQAEVEEFERVASAVPVPEPEAIAESREDDEVVVDGVEINPGEYIEAPEPVVPESNVEENEDTQVELAKPDEVLAVDEERIAETVEYEQEEDSEPDAAEPDAYQTKIDEAQAEEDEADTETAEIDQAREEYSEVIERKKVSGRQLQAAFSFNERFRFAKELFGGSTTAFSTILEEISTFGTAGEVKTYLSEMQGIDVAVGPGKDFFQKIAPFFG